MQHQHKSKVPQLPARWSWMPLAFNNNSSAPSARLTQVVLCWFCTRSLLFSPNSSVNIKMDSKPPENNMSDRARKIINIALMQSMTCGDSTTQMTKSPVTAIDHAPLDKIELSQPVFDHTPHRGLSAKAVIDLALGVHGQTEASSSTCRPRHTSRPILVTDEATDIMQLDQPSKDITGSNADLVASDSDGDKDWEPSSDTETEIAPRSKRIVQYSESSEEELEEVVLADLEEEVEEIVLEEATEQRSKKRQRRPENWKRAVKKQKKNTGVVYTNSGGNIVRAKKLKDPCGNKCRLKCSEKMSLETRQTIIDGFWALNDINRQRDFISRSVEEICPQYRQKKPASTRSLNYAYHLLDDGKKIKVCKTFFMNTLDVGNTFVRTAFKKQTPAGFVASEMRGKHGNQLKLDDAIKQGVRDHIKSFDKIESHYCRSQTTKEYLNGDLNIATMYRLYKEDCLIKNINAGKMYLYDTIFRTEFNLSFFKPKKDLCGFCESHKNSNDTEKSENLEAFTKHIHEKVLSRKEKEKDCNDAKVTGNVVCCYDLQSVFTSPCGDVSVFYYKRKLNSYNFTIFDINDKKGYCYMWHEGLALRGSNEIGTCVLTYLKQNCIGKEVTFYSDNCVGQNKNQYIVAMYIHAVSTLEIKSITHKYLIVGHTQNEGDAMHSCIEREKKRILRGGPVYTPSQWIPVVRLAKKNGHPYTVTEMGTEDFVNIKKLAQDASYNFSKDVDGKKVVWNEIKVIKVEKEEPGTIFFKTSYEDEEYRKIIVIRRGRGRKGMCENDLVPLYKEPPKIPFQKKKDLLSMCKDKAIPTVHHEFFTNLSAVSKNVQPPNEEDSDA